MKYLHKESRCTVSLERDCRNIIKSSGVISTTTSPTTGDANVYCMLTDIVVPIPLITMATNETRGKMGIKDEAAAHLWEFIKINHANCESMSVEENAFVKFDARENLVLSYDKYNSLVVVLLLLILLSDAFSNETKLEQGSSSKCIATSTRVPLSTDFTANVLL